MFGDPNDSLGDLDEENFLLEAIEAENQIASRKRHSDESENPIQSKIQSNIFTVSSQESSDIDLTLSEDLFNSKPPLVHSPASVISPIFCARNNSIQKNSFNKSLSTPVAQKRRFPGPAGLLTNKEESPQTTKSTPKSVNKGNNFTTAEQLLKLPLWLQMLKCLETEAAVHRVSVADVTSKQKQRHLMDVPVMCVLIDAIECRGSADASVVITDHSGSMQGTMHRQLMKDYTEAMTPGSVLVLKKVGIFSPSIRTCYLNITPANVVRVHHKECTSGTRISAFTPSDFEAPRPPPVIRRLPLQRSQTPLHLIQRPQIPLHSHQRPQTPLNSYQRPQTPLIPHSQRPTPQYSIQRPGASSNSTHPYQTSLHNMPGPRTPLMRPASPVKDLWQAEDDDDSFLLDCSMDL